jgi:hypothetical protein
MFCALTGLITRFLSTFAPQRQALPRDRRSRALERPSQAGESPDEQTYPQEL